MTDNDLTEARVATIPDCDICKHHHPGQPDTWDAAYADAATPMGWAFVCKHHFDEYGCKLGTGKGQVLIKVQA